MAAQPRPDPRAATARALRYLRLTAAILAVGGIGGWIQVHVFAVSRGYPFWSVAPEGSGWLGMASAGAIGFCAVACLKVLAARVSDIEDRRSLAEAS